MNNIKTIVNTIAAGRVESTNDIIVEKIREIMGESGIGEFYDIDENEILRFVKEHKALEVIKSKPVNTNWFVFFKDYDEYCLTLEYANESKRLTEEEWNLLKEVLKR